MSNKVSYQALLKRLCRKLAAEEMSLLVGSGFSRNVSDKFPTWDKLLVGMAYKLYEKDIDSTYEAYATGRNVEPEEKKAFIENQCKYIIEQQGYLEIASAYVKRMGTSESIVTYIEEHMPYISQQKGAYVLEYNGISEPLPNEKLLLHKDLIDLPWNNIYTTNYDNLLDICVDNDRHKRLKAEINDLEAEILNINKQINNHEAEKEALSRPETTKESLTNLPNPTELTVSEKEEIIEVEKKKQELSSKINKLKRIRRQAESLMAIKEREINRCYRIVKSGSELSIKKRKNIIKLHGSLRSRSERGRFYFEFDGDHRTQYIIAKEDYENYTKKHEAFTQLMRISLLQESFCLIGFSASDPNFLQWIGWVRDILYKSLKQEGKDKEYYKIYLVDVGNQDVPDHMQLFYENHNIFRIPLGNPEVVKILQENSKTGIDAKDGKSLIAAFIKYLHNDEHIKPDIPSENSSIRKEYQNIWTWVPAISKDKLPDERDVAERLKKIQTARRQFWLPDLPVPILSGQKSLVGHMNNAEKWQEKLNKSAIYRKVLIAAVEDYSVPLRQTLKDDVIKILLNHKDAAKGYQKLVSRNDALAVNLKALRLSKQDQALRLAYSFQFAELRAFLEKWTASGRQLIVKAGLMSIMDREAAKNILAEALKGHVFDGQEEIIYGLEMMRIVERDNDVASRHLLEYKRSGYTGLTEKLILLQEQAAEKKRKIEPYGIQRIRQNFSLFGSDNSAILASLQFIMLLAESGFSLVTNYTYLLSSDDWYPVMKAGFKFYPKPFLFYSLQYNDTDFLKRIGQEYAFSEDEDVVRALDNICKALFKSLLTAPPTIAQNTKVVLSIMVIAVKPVVWQTEFINWWRYLITKRRAFGESHANNNSLLITSALQYTENNDVLEEVLSDCLRDVLNNSHNDAITKIFHLKQNVQFRNFLEQQRNNGIITDLIARIILRIKTNSINNLFAIWYLFPLLTQGNVDTVRKQLLEIDFSQVKSLGIWRVFLYFIGDHKTLHSRVRKGLISQSKLWHTGIDERSVHGFGGDFISITAMSFSNYQKDGLKWNKTQLKSIYIQLKDSLNKIVKLNPKFKEEPISFTAILEEMVEFLEMFQSQLASLSDFHTTQLLAIQERNISRKYANIEEGLTSQNATVIRNSIGELDRMVYMNSFRNEYITLLLNRILFQAEPHVETALGYISIWLYYKDRGEKFRSQQSLLVQILKKYESDPLKEAAKDFVQDRLVRIAWKLKKWQNQDPVIDVWLKKAANSRFNNVHQFLARVKSHDPDSDVINSSKI